MEPPKKEAQWLWQILRLTQSGGSSRRGQRQNDRRRCTVEEWSRISKLLVSVEIPAYISVNIKCVILLASITANGNSEVQFSFRWHKPFFLNPCGFSLNSVSNSSFFGTYSCNQHSKVMYYSKPWFCHGVYITTFILHLSMKQFSILVALKNPKYY